MHLLCSFPTPVSIERAGRPLNRLVAEPAFPDQTRQCASPLLGYHTDETDRSGTRLDAFSSVPACAPMLGITCSASNLTRCVLVVH